MLKIVKDFLTSHYTWLSYLHQKGDFFQRLILALTELLYLASVISRKTHELRLLWTSRPTSKSENRKQQQKTLVLWHLYICSKSLRVLFYMEAIQG